MAVLHKWMAIETLSSGLRTTTTPRHICIGDGAVVRAKQRREDHGDSEADRGEEADAAATGSEIQKEVLRHGQASIRPKGIHR
jgi:hypothetical protein